jgi:hypothetical protein
MVVDTGFENVTATASLSVQNLNLRVIRYFFGLILPNGDIWSCNKVQIGYRVDKSGDAS